MRNACTRWCYETHGRGWPSVASADSTAAPTERRFPDCKCSLDEQHATAGAIRESIIRNSIVFNNSPEKLRTVEWFRVFDIHSKPTRGPTRRRTRLVAQNTHVGTHKRYYLMVVALASVIFSIGLTRACNVSRKIKTAPCKKRLKILSPFETRLKRPPIIVFF